MFNETEFKVACVRAGKSYGDVANALKIDRSTLYRKLKNDGDFSREEISTMIDFLKMENPKQVFFA